MHQPCVRLTIVAVVLASGETSLSAAGSPFADAAAVWHMDKLQTGGGAEIGRAHV